MRLLLSIMLLPLFASSTGAQSPANGAFIKDVRAAVERALPIMERSATRFVEERSCFSCHHNALPILTFHMARDRGFQIDARTLSLVEEKAFRNLRSPTALDDAIQGVHLSDPTPNDSYLLMAAEAASVEPDLTTGIYARRMSRWQRNGHWVTSDFRPPHSSSLFSATATAIRAIRAYMPENLAAERNAIIRDAAQWLVKTKPVSTEDAAFRLMGLIWAGVPPSSQTEAIRDLALMQKRDGGWGQLPNYDSDAYSTGEALFALREAGAEMSNIQIQRALKFLLSSQERNGAWRMHTRMVSPAEVSPPYFSTGFPYGKDEFLSYAGTSWAVMGLLSTLSDQPQLASMKPQTLKTPQESQEQWTRVALFGSAQELERLLDEGLKPDTSTPNGTTLLMMVAPDAAKTRIVLARGANAVTRTASGADALTIACGYRGAAASIAALLDAGALAEPPEDTHVRRAPLVLASMTGDLENVRLLLARGAKPSVESLSEAVTFGYAEIVQALIRAGADPMLTERSGINLLHWATITGRSNVIPVLVAARVPINAQDEHGFTPLMYAATLDTGPPETLINLLRAGADTRLRNTDGRTALDLAKRYNRTDAAAVLKGP